jgi:hypothetical protein
MQQRQDIVCEVIFIATVQKSQSKRAGICANSARGEPKHRANENCNENVRRERHQTEIKADAGAAGTERMQGLEIV